MTVQYIVRKTETEKGDVFFMIPNDLPLGNYHDVLMSEKGWCVEKMIAAQKEEEGISEKLQKENDE